MNKFMLFLSGLLTIKEMKTLQMTLPQVHEDMLYKEVKGSNGKITFSKVLEVQGVRF